jgi:rare lipoprotein A
MRNLKFQTLTAAIVCGVALCTSTAVPAAHAGILNFLSRHLLGNRSQTYSKPTVGFDSNSNDRTVPRNVAASSAYTKNSAHNQSDISALRLTRAFAPQRPAQHRLACARPSQKVRRAALHHQNSIQLARAYPSITTPKAQHHHAPSNNSGAVRERLAAQATDSEPFHNSLDILPPSAPMLTKMDLSSSPVHKHGPKHDANRPLESDDQAFSTRASWYGPGFDGKRTASGERYNQEGLTAASRTLPLGSKVLVANPTTGKCCTVTINDRGPYVSGRDIDLSHGAATKIGITGVSPVICVAYAPSQEAANSPLPASSGNRLNNRRQPVSRYRKTTTLSASQREPAKLSGKVMHLIAGIF